MLNTHITGTRSRMNWRAAEAGQVVVQIEYKGQCVALHLRRTHEYKRATNQLYMPVQHRVHVSWTHERLVEIGRGIGPFTCLVVDTMLKSKAHPEHAYRAVFGLRVI
jgi:hypothetical protein